MRKILSTVAISAVLSTGAIAGDLYGSMGAAVTSPTGGWDSGISVVVTGGMKLDSVFPGFAAEVEVSQTVVDPSYSWSGYGASGDIDLSVLGVGAYAVYNFQIPGNALVIKPRLGFNYQSWSIDGNGWSGAEADDTSLSFGIGATYPISNGLIVYADFTDKGDSNNIGAGVGMSF